MKLNYRILWFDDSEEFFESLDLEHLKQKISENGFNPFIETVTNPEDFSKYSPFEQIDLIVVDRNLELSKNGQEFIAEIRANQVYTEVIFYTAGQASDLWDAIKEKKLEGVFVSTRSMIEAKIQSVFRQSVRKVLDLENMRGIVMAEVGELDLLLEEIVTKGLNSIEDEKKAKIFSDFHNDAFKQSNASLEKLEQFKSNPSVDGLLALCDSNKRWSNFNRLKKVHEDLKTKEKIGDYVELVLKPRNFLAHGRPEVQEENVVKFSFHNKEYIFNEKVSTELRQTILKFKEYFSEIANVL